MRVARLIYGQTLVPNDNVLPLERKLFTSTQIKVKLRLSLTLVLEQFSDRLGSRESEVKIRQVHCIHAGIFTIHEQTHGWCRRVAVTTGSTLLLR